MKFREAKGTKIRVGMFEVILGRTQKSNRECFDQLARGLDMVLGKTSVVAHVDAGQPAYPYSDKGRVRAIRVFVLGELEAVDPLKVVLIDGVA